MEKDCVRGPGVVQKYLNKIGGPLLDRIDFHVEVTPVNFDELSEKRKGEPSEKVRGTCFKAREIQTDRFSEVVYSNSMMSSCKIRPEHIAEAITYRILDRESWTG